MTIDQVVGSYGYLVILVGTFLEGETVLVLGGIAANSGYLNLSWVIATAFIGSVLGDQFFFLLGRRQSRWFLAKRPYLKARLEKARSLLDRYQTPLVVGFRFLYGFRAVIPFVIGTSRITIKRFFILNLIGAALWSVSFGLGGYLFGQALQMVLGNLKSHEWEIMGGILVLGAALWTIHLLFSKRKVEKK